MTTEIYVMYGSEKVNPLLMLGFEVASRGQGIPSELVSTGRDVWTQISEDQGDHGGLMQTRRLEYWIHCKIYIVSHWIKYVLH